MALPRLARGGGSAVRVRAHALGRKGHTPQRVRALPSKIGVYVYRYVGIQV